MTQILLKMNSIINRIWDDMDFTNLTNLTDVANNMDFTNLTDDLTSPDTVNHTEKIKTLKETVISTLTVKDIIRYIQLEQAGIYKLSEDMKEFIFSHQDLLKPQERVRTQPNYIISKNDDIINSVNLPNFDVSQTIAIVHNSRIHCNPLYKYVKPLRI